MTTPTFGLGEIWTSNSMSTLGLQYVFIDYYSVINVTLDVHRVSDYIYSNLLYAYHTSYGVIRARTCAVLEEL